MRIWSWRLGRNGLGRFLAPPLPSPRELYVAVPQSRPGGGSRTRDWRPAAMKQKSKKARENPGLSRIGNGTTDQR